MERIPRFIDTDIAMIPQVEQGEYGDVNLSNLRIFAQGIHTIALDETHAIPDMLQPDFTLEQNLDSTDQQVSQKAFDQWIGFYATLALDADGNIGAQTYPTTTLMQGANPLLMQALGRSLSMRQIASITLYSGQITSGGINYTCAIGYSYQDGNVLHFCPAASIRHDFSPIVHPGCFDPDAMAFINPLPLLITPAFMPQAAALVGNLMAVQNTLPACLQPKVSAFIEQFAQIADDDVELKPFGGLQNLAPMYHAMAQWFTPKLLVIDTAWAGMWRNTYAALAVQNANANPVPIGVVAPLTNRYASDLYALKNGGAAQAATYTAIRNCFEAPNATVTEYDTPAGKSYKLRFSYLGQSYAVTYGVASCIHLNPMTMPYVALWPQRDVATWNEYLIYSCHSDAAHANAMKLFPCTFDAQGNLTRHAPAVDRTTDTRNIWDSVTKTDRFPHFIAVDFGGTHIGMLMPREAQGGAVAAAPTTIAIDFGSTNTIAYAGSAGAVPQPMTIGSAVLEVCGTNDNVTTTLNFANSTAYAQAQFLSLINTFGAPHFAAQQYREWEETTIPFTDAITITPELANHLHLGLKKPGAQTQREAYLKQLAAIYRWNVVAAGGTLNPRVTWRFAYPRSMPAPETVVLQMGFRQIFGINGMNVQFCSEAAAVGAYITSPAMVASIGAKGYAPVDMQKGYMILDIGGGTVDYSLWQANAGEVSASIRSEASMWQVAGAFAIQEMIQHKHVVGVPANTALLWQLWNDVIDPADRRVTGLKTQVIDSLINNTALDAQEPLHVQLLAYMEARNDPRMAGYIDKIDHMFDTAWSTNVGQIMQQIHRACIAAMINDGLSEVKRFMVNVELYFSLLIYFAGELAGASINEGRLTMADNELFSLALAGNGSTLLSFLPDYSIGQAGAGVPFQQSLLQERLCQFFHAGLREYSDARPRLQIVEPLMAKQEVAYGLCNAALVQDGPLVATDWQRATGQADIRERADSFAEAYYRIVGVDIQDMLRTKVNAVQAAIAVKGRDEAFRDLIHHTLE